MNTTDENYQGYPNRETWAVALHINNDQGWQEQVHEMLRSVDWDIELKDRVINVQHIGNFMNQRAGEMLEDALWGLLEAAVANRSAAEMETYVGIRNDIGSTWRVDWDCLGAEFLADVREIDAA